MTITDAPTMSESPAPMQSGEADGPAPVAPPAAPPSRVIAADAGRWFVHSNTVPGAWWKVEFVPGYSLTCSCPHGLRVGTDINAKPCRHKRAVLFHFARPAAS